MADALVERSPPARFFCHRCNIEFDHILQDFTCPFCASGFIEQLEGDAEAPGSGDEFSDADMSTIDEMSNLDDSDDTHNSTPPMLNDLAFLMSGGRLRGAGRRETLMEQLVLMIGGSRAGGAHAAVAANGAPFVLVGAPGDYVFGGEGLDAVVTQLLGQLEHAGPPPLPRDRLTALPTELATEAHANASCSICWDNFQLGETLSRLECEHLFHSSCITPWLQLHATCPICRRSLLPEEPPPAAAATAPSVGASRDADTESTSASAPQSDSSAGGVPDLGTVFLGLLGSLVDGLVQLPEAAAAVSQAVLATRAASQAAAEAMEVQTQASQVFDASLPRVSLRRLTRRAAAEAASASDTTTSGSQHALSSESSASMSSDRPSDADRYNMDIDYD